MTGWFGKGELGEFVTLTRHAGNGPLVSPQAPRPTAGRVQRPAHGGGHRLQQAAAAVGRNRAGHAQESQHRQHADHHEGDHGRPRLPQFLREKWHGGCQSTLPRNPLTVSDIAAGQVSASVARGGQVSSAGNSFRLWRRHLAGVLGLRCAGQKTASGTPALQGACITAGLHCDGVPKLSVGKPGRF